MPRRTGRCGWRWRWRRGGTSSRSSTTTGRPPPNYTSIVLYTVLDLYYIICDFISSSPALNSFPFLSLSFSFSPSLTAIYTRSRYEPPCNRSTPHLSLTHTQRRHLHEEQAVSICMGVTQALIAAHRVGVLHRNLIPAHGTRAVAYYSLSARPDTGVLSERNRLLYLFFIPFPPRWRRTPH